MDHMLDGVLNINKPAGWTSQDVCAKLRRRLKIKRIGHTGTLDPMATGVLPVCIGKATRIIEYYDLDRKTYHAAMKLGVVSDTLDIWGDTDMRYQVRIISGTGSNYDSTAADDTSEVEDIRSMTVSVEDIHKAFSAYTGRVTQIPPKYSALKVNGKRAYDLARQGEEFELKGRDITIYSNEVSRIDTDTAEIEFDVTCSKGTYIRTICDDIGRTLGCRAVMSSLERTASGYFEIGKATDVRDLIEMDDTEIEKLIIPMEKTLTSLGTVQLNDNRFTAFINGNSSAAGFQAAETGKFTDSDGDLVYKVFNGSLFLGTAVLKGRELIPAKVIYNR